MAVDTFFLGENAQSFKTAPKFDMFDMVVLNIDENTYVSSPYVAIDEEKWEAYIPYGGTNGEFEFVYDRWNRCWVCNGNHFYDYYDESNDILHDDLYDSLGITHVFAQGTPQPKEGDVITVRRFADETDSENPKVELTVELTRSGQKMEANCPLVKPSEREAVAHDLLRSICGYQYQPFQASGAEVNPLMELGDGITAHGIYSGMFEQTLNFESMMTSEIGAPWAEETESEYNYETARERKFNRKFADIAAEFEIKASEINAKVSRTGTGTGFGWSLIESAFKVFVTGHENNPEFMVDANGLHVTGNGIFTGEVRATSGYIGDSTTGFTISASAIKNGMTSLTDIYHNGVYVGTDGIALGQGKFKVTSSGEVTASNLTITGGEIKIGGTANSPVFHVTSAGAVTASNLTIIGGEIKIGGTANSPVFHVTSAGAVTASNLTIIGGEIKLGGTLSNPNFHVDTSGNLYAESGTFNGHVKANKIDTGSSDGYISGSMFDGGSIGTTNLSYGINTNLANAKFSADVFSGAATAAHLWADDIRSTNTGNSMYIYNHRCVWITDGTLGITYLSYIGNI